MDINQTNFMKVVNFNHQFGVIDSVVLNPKDNVLKDDPKLAQFCFKLVDEEINETLEAVSNSDFIEFVDGLCDSLFVVYGQGCRFGVNLDLMIRNKYLDDRKYFHESNFKIVCRSEKWDYISDPLKGLSPKVSLLKENPEKVCGYLDDVVNLRDKLEESIKNQNFLDCIGILTNLIYALYSVGHKMGVDLDVAFDAVYKNNMSKLCISEEEAQDTVEKYKAEIHKTGYDSPTYRPAPDGVHWVVYNESTRKILKSINWKPVDLSFVVE